MAQKERKRVVVGLSGGVDSSVAAWLLREQGYEVIGLFMRNWNDESVVQNNDCAWIDDSNDAMLVAQSLGIPFQVLDLSEQYRERIVDYMFAEYAAGRTPNPDVLCNREIKFDVFLKAALALGADFVATGHYCQKETTEVNGKTVHRLLAGADAGKDQSYFLCQLTQEQLRYALFPIGHLQKKRVRELAAEAGLVTHNKKDSQGLCFVGKISLPDFLQQKLEPKEGAILEVAAADISPYPDNSWQTLTAAPKLDAGRAREVGRHRGAHYFTVGQRKGLQVGGKAEPLFVVGTDVARNLLFTGMGENHPALLRKGLRIARSEVHWIRPDLALQPGEEGRFLVRIRYRQQLVEATLRQEEDLLYVVFDEPLRGVAPGQFCAWYRENEVIGSGIIAEG